MVALQKFLIVSFLLIAFACWARWIFLDSYYYQHGATSTSVAEGRIYPKKVHHGWQVFLTRKEKFNLDVLYPSIFFGSVLIAGLLDLRWKHFYFRKDSHGMDLFYWFKGNKKK